MIIGMLVGMVLLSFPTPREMPKPPPEDRLPLSATKSQTLRTKNLSACTS